MIHEVDGHFGEWIQGLDGHEIVAVTVRCPALRVRAERLSDGALELEADDALLSIERTARFLERLGLPPGRFRLSADMPPGGGAGASTAALVALARAAGYVGGDLAEACLEVEGATDPLMLAAPDAVLWAPRRALTVERLMSPPDAEIVGGFYGRPVRTDPSDVTFPDIGDLVGAWRRAKTLAECAAIASEAAVRTSALRGPFDDPTAKLAAELGALGWLRAHTGSARGLIFATGCVPADAIDRVCGAGFAGVVRFETGERA